MKKELKNVICIGKKNKRYVLFQICILMVVAGTILAACRANNGMGENQLKDSALNNKQTYTNSVKGTSTNLRQTEIPNDSLTTATQDAGAKNDLNEKMAVAMTKKFCDDMTSSWFKLKRVDMSDYLLDNLDTHLALKWIDFDIADRKQNSWKQLVSIDSVLLSNGIFEKTSETKASYEAFVEIKYSRYEPSVNGIGIDLTVGFEKIDNKWMITSLDTMGSSIYRKWKVCHYTTIEQMDKAFGESCKEQGLIVKNTEE